MQVIHSWVLNHFVDFESNTELFGKLEKFIDALKEKVRINCCFFFIIFLCFGNCSNFISE